MVDYYITSVGCFVEKTKNFVLVVLSITNFISNTKGWISDISNQTYIMKNKSIYYLRFSKQLETDSLQIAENPLRNSRFHLLSVQLVLEI